jgi:hypothetical protein
MPMYSACGSAALPALGFPIRESTDHRLFSAYPWLIAAVHALHRLLVPRHPPCALLILTVITHSTRRRARGDTRYIGKTVQFSRTALEAPAGLAAGLSKLNSMRDTRHEGARLRLPSRLRRRAQAGSVDIARTWPLIGPRYAARRRSRRSNPGGFPRKEVIQPHLPVRLPCYDFTPVTSPTFDGSLPEGLGHRLRVLLASVV